jgi:hypothetical protein
MSWSDNRPDEPKGFQDAGELDGIDVTGIVDMDVDVTSDEHWAAVDNEQLKHGCELVEEFSGDRSGSLDGQRHNV